MILAEAGEGKTKEFEECAKKIQAEGKFSFLFEYPAFSEQYHRVYPMVSFT